MSLLQNSPYRDQRPKPSRQFQFALAEALQTDSHWLMVTRMVTQKLKGTQMLMATQTGSHWQMVKRSVKQMHLEILMVKQRHLGTQMLMATQTDSHWMMELNQ